MILLQLPTVHVAFVGKVDRPQLSRWMGKNYTIQWYDSIQSASRSLPDILVIDKLPLNQNWMTARDTFVPRLERELERVQKDSPKTRLFVVLPSHEDQPSFDATTLDEQVVPLLRQAAEESGVQTISLDASPSIAEQIAESTVDFNALKSHWHLVSADSEEADEGPAKNAIDGDLKTYWHTRYDPKPDRYPHQLIVDMGQPSRIAGFRYVPRQDGGTNGRVKKFEFYTSEDGSSWSAPQAVGLLPNTSKATLVRFSSPVQARYFKFVALSEQNNQPYASAAEIDVIPAPEP